MKVPVRRCVVCRVSGRKSELLRLALKDCGEVCADEAQSLPGRGVYVHRSAACLSGLRDEGKLDYGFRVERGKLDLEKLRNYLCGVLREL